MEESPRACGESVQIAVPASDQAGFRAHWGSSKPNAHAWGYETPRSRNAARTTSHHCHPTVLRREPADPFGRRQQWRGILRRLERRYPDKRINEYTSHDLRDCRCAEPPGRRSTSSGADAPVADRRGDRSAVRCVPSRSGRGARRARCLGARFLSAVWFAHPRNRQHSLGGHQFARKHTFGARQGSQAGHYLPTGGLGEMLTHWRTRAADGLGRLPVADDPLLITFRSKGGDARRSTPGRGMG